MNIVIRSYKSTDQASVRQICCDTADKGEAIERIFMDRECAADLLTGYYLTYEPQACFVALDDDKVIGYILASFDNRRYGLVMAFILIPAVIVKGFKKGLFFQRSLWVLVKGMIKNWRRLLAWRKESFHSHQAHMHIGVAHGYQRQQVGCRLVHAVLEYAKTQAIDEITASVHDGNTRACLFFDHLGFTIRQRYPMVVATERSIETYQSLLYVKKIL